MSSTESIVVVDDSDTDTEEQSCHEDSLSEQEVDDRESDSEESLSVSGPSAVFQHHMTMSFYNEPSWKDLPAQQYEFEVFRGRTPITLRKLALRQSCFLVGRHPTSELFLTNESCELFHAVLQVGRRRSPQVRLYVYDLGNEQGTFVNGVRAHAYKYVALTDGDVLRFGESENLFYFHDPNEPERKEESSEEQIPARGIQHHNDFLSLPNLTSSQMVQLQTVVDGVGEFGESHDQLTRTQVNRLQVHLHDLVNIQNTLLQMLENNLDDEDVTSNLINLLEYLNHGISMQERLAQYVQDTETELDPLPQDININNALVLSQVMAAVAEDENTELEGEMFSIMAQEENNLNQVLQDMVASLENLDIGEFPTPPPEPSEEEMDRFCYRNREPVPEAWRKAEGGDLESLPLYPEWDGKKIDATPTFTSTGITLCTWAAPTHCGVQYVEIAFRPRMDELAAPEDTYIQLVLRDDRVIMTDELIRSIPRHSPVSVFQFPAQVERIVQSQVGYDHVVLRNERLTQETGDPSQGR